MRASFPILYENLSGLNIEERTILDVNTDTLSLLENGLSNENPSRAAQARMIVGESGSGKTFLLARLFQSVKTDDIFTFHHPFNDCGQRDNPQV